MYHVTMLIVGLKMRLSCYLAPLQTYSAFKYWRDLKIWVMGSFKVIGDTTIRQIAYEYLFVFHSNYDRILYCFRNKATYWLKNANFTYSFYSFINVLTVLLNYLINIVVWHYISFIKLSHNSLTPLQIFSFTVALISLGSKDEKFHARANFRGWFLHYLLYNFNQKISENCVTLRFIIWLYKRSRVTFTKLLSAVVKISFSMIFPWLSMTFAIFHDFPCLENGLPKFYDFSWPGGTLI